MFKTLAVLGTCTLFLTACGGGQGLHNFRTNAGGPDAFSVMPNLALAQPADLTTLPQPTPGGANRADPNPAAEAAAALGGRGSGRGQAGDGALLQTAGRFGTTPTIRADLAEDDRSFRRIRGRLASGRGSSKYFRAYASMMLNAYAELERFRAAGVRTPSAPPK